MNSEDRRQLVDVLAWYRDMGVSDAVAAEPVDWTAREGAAPGAAFAWPDAVDVPQAGIEPGPPRPSPGGQQRSRPPLAPPPQPPPAARRFPTAAPDAAAENARAGASGAKSLAEIIAALERFDGCALKATAKNTCVWRGAERAPLMIIGEAPGRDEDLEGKPFVGRAGQMLDRMLAAIGLDESKVHITNIVYWRPPGNRTPTPVEAQLCRPFLLRQMELVAPSVVLAVGGAAAKHLFEVEEGIMKLRGRWREIEIGGRRVPAMATLHPAYLLRTPEAKRLVWRDLVALSKRLGTG